MKKIIFIILLFSSMNTFAAQVDTLEVFSAKMNKKVGVVVITPSNYADKGKKFPVLYLLHGMSDTHTKWVKTVPNIKNLADQYQIMIVCPDGGYSSMYLDSPIDPASQYETFIAKELLKYIDTKYKTVASKNGRIITGLSMGGHGALYLAGRNPETYIAAGSMSGATDTWKLGFKEWAEKEVGKWLGSFKANPELWRQHSVIHNLHLLKKANIPFYIDCGVNDFLLEENRELHRRMVYENIAHEYIERPGGHEWPYWANAIVYQLGYLTQFLKRE